MLFLSPVQWDHYFLTSVHSYTLKSALHEYFESKWDFLKNIQAFVFPDALYLFSYVTLQLCCNRFLHLISSSIEKSRRSIVCKQISFSRRLNIHTHHECMVNAVWPSVLVTVYFGFFFFLLWLELCVIFTMESWIVDSYFTFLLAITFQEW